MTESDLSKYVNAAADLAESVKRDIQKNEQVSENTIVALNSFIIVSNQLKKEFDLLQKSDIIYQ